jgi:hypothetical protein
MAKRLNHTVRPKYTSPNSCTIASLLTPYSINSTPDVDNAPSVNTPRKIETTSSDAIMIPDKRGATTGGLQSILSTRQCTQVLFYAMSFLRPFNNGLTRSAQTPSVLSYSQTMFAGSFINKIRSVGDKFSLVALVKNGLGYKMNTIITTGNTSNIAGRGPSGSTSSSR